jgi:hypothetical protein
VNPGPLNFIYFLTFTTLPLSHSGSPLGVSRLTSREERTQGVLFITLTSEKMPFDVTCEFWWRDISSLEPSFWPAAEAVAAAAVAARAAAEEVAGPGQRPVPVASNALRLC